MHTPFQENPAGPLELENLSSSERIVRAIVRDLNQGRYAPGQRLIEADLTARYNASRGPIRQALRRLAADGLVVMERHRGAYVRSIDYGEALEIFRVHEVLVGLSARLAAKGIHHGGMAERLDASLSRVLSYQPADTSAEYGHARSAFFQTLVDIGGNPQLDKILATQQLGIIVVRIPEYSKPIQAARYEDFLAIGKAVLAGDLDAAERAARRHVSRVRDIITMLHSEAQGPFTTHVMGLLSSN